MQLQKRFNRKVGDTEYSKWQVIIPPETIKQLGWKEGEDLTEHVSGIRLTLTPKSKAVEFGKSESMKRPKRMMKE